MRNKGFALIFLTSFLFLQSCGLWENFTTYFNRYYNARVAFDEVEEEIDNLSQKELFEFKEPTSTSKSKGALDNVIEKCSKILQFNKESGYFDAALFMIGKAYYYQGNYTKALRKFRELESIQETELTLDNKLWIAKSELQMRRFDVGTQILDEVKTEAENLERDDLLYQAYLVEVKYLNYREDYVGAIRVVKKLLEVSDSDEINAQLAYETGKLYLKIEDFENAANSFVLIDDYSPTFDIQFQGKLELAKVYRNLKKIDECKEILDDLASEEKFKDNLDLVEIESANLLFDEEKYEDALDLYTKVDTTYKTKETSGVAAFKRAEIVEKKFGDLDSAEVLYDRVSKSKAPKEIKDLARDRTNVFKEITKKYNEMDQFRRQYVYIQDTTLFKSDSLLYVNYFAQKDSLAKLMVEMKQLQGRDFDSTKYVMKEEPPFAQKPVMPTLSEDSLVTKIVRNEYDLAGLYFSELELPDSAYYYYRDILDSFSYTRYHARTLFALGSFYLTMDEKEKADSLFNVVYENYKEDKIVNAAAEKLGKSKIEQDVDPAQLRYSEVEKIYSDKDFNKAISEFFNISKSYPGSPYAAKSLYTIGFILENDLNMNDSAAVIYDSLVTKYGTTAYAGNVRSRLSFFKMEKKRLSDSVAAAEKALNKKEEQTPEKITDEQDQDEQQVDENKDIIAADEKGKPLKPVVTTPSAGKDSVKTGTTKFVRPGRPRAKK